MNANQNVMGIANDVKELLLDAMVKDGVVTQENADVLKQTYAVVAVRRGWLGRFIDRLFWKGNEPETETKMVVMKVIK